MTESEGRPARTSQQAGLSLERPAPGDLNTLLGAVARGEHGAFELVYEQLWRRIDSRVRAVLRDDAQTEEVTQEVFLELWRTAFRYDPAKGSATAWALTIAHRRAVDRVRSAAASSARELRAAEPATLGDDVNEAIQNVLDHERLRDCLHELSSLQREAIILAFYGGHSYSQVAAILGVPLGTVKARIRDGLIRLRAAMLGFTTKGDIPDHGGT